MPSVELAGVRNHICRDLWLKIDSGELLVLIGPTGAGKTTLLNVIAGLVPYRGQVRFDGRPVDDLPAMKRRVGYVLQNYCLFPHLSVYENIAFGLKGRNLQKETIHERVRELLVLFRLQSLANRYPRKGLSGGEQQRVALARALAPWPHVLLLDEPLNSLDLRTAKYLRMELRNLQQRLKITTLYVTHNQQDASEIGDRVALLNQGTIEQSGRYQDLYFHPRNKEVARFLGSPNIFSCRRYTPLGSGLAEVQLAGFSLVVPFEGRHLENIAISPWCIFLSPLPVPGPEVNRLQGEILEVDANAALTKVTVRCGQERIVVELRKELWDETGLQTGDETFLVLPLRWIQVYEDYAE